MNEYDQQLIVSSKENSDYPSIYFLNSNKISILYTNFNYLIIENSGITVFKFIFKRTNKRIHTDYKR